MDVYIELTYFINAFLIIVCFEILAYFLNLRFSFKQLLFYSSLLNISCLLLFFDLFDGFLFFYQFFFFSIIFKKQSFLYFPLYLFIYSSLISFFHFLCPYSYIFQGILLIERFSILLFFLFAFVFGLSFCFFISWSKNKSRHIYFDVEFSHHQCIGLLDSGNEVFYKGYPVIFICKDLLEDYPIIDVMDVETIHGVHQISLIQLQEIKINKMIIHNVYVGLMPTCAYPCILNTQLLGGLL